MNASIFKQTQTLHIIAGRKKTSFVDQITGYRLCTLKRTGDDARRSISVGAVLLVLDYAGDAAVRVVEVAVAVDGASGTTCDHDPCNV